MKPAALPGALQRFAGFFSAPLLLADSLSRERQAVQSEFAGVLLTDGCRGRQLLYDSCCRRDSPLSKFLWGSEQSLAAAGREELVEFMGAHYSADSMCMCVLGAESLDAQEQQVAAAFGAVANPATAATAAAPCPPPLPAAAAGSPFTVESAGTLVLCEPIMQGHFLCLCWAVPPVCATYGGKSADMLGHLLGHEGAGSLTSALKAAGLIIGLASSVGEEEEHDNDLFALFSVDITLTDAGVARLDEVTSAVLQYVVMLQRHGAEQLRWVWEELRDINSAEFRFLEEGESADTVSMLAQGMMRKQPQHTLNGEYLYAEYKPQQVEEILGCLTLRALRAVLMSRTPPAFAAAAGAEAGAEAGAGAGLAATRTEAHFNVEYRCVALDLASIERHSADSALFAAGTLVLPPRNPYVASEFELLPASTGEGGGEGGDEGEGESGEGVETPVALSEFGSAVRMFYKADITYKTPKAVLWLSFKNPLFGEGAAGAVWSELFARLLTDTMNELTVRAPCWCCYCSRARCCCSYCCCCLHAYVACSRSIWRKWQSCTRACGWRQRRRFWT